MEAEIHPGVRDSEDVIKELRTDVKNLCNMLTEDYREEYPPSTSAKGRVVPDWVVLARCKAIIRESENSINSSSEDVVNIYGAPGSQWMK